MDFLAFILASQAGLSVAKVRFKRSTASRGGMPFTMGPLRSYSARKRTTSFGVATTWTVWSSLPIKGWQTKCQNITGSFLKEFTVLMRSFLYWILATIEGVTPATKLRRKLWKSKSWFNALSIQQGCAWHPQNIMLLLELDIRQGAACERVLADGLHSHPRGPHGAKKIVGSFRRQHRRDKSACSNPGWNLCHMPPRQNAR